jgi:hypothetical protein
VLDLKRYQVVDDVSIVNADGSETPLASHAATVDVHVVFQHPTGAPVPIGGLTEPTLVFGIVPIAVPQEPFSGQMHVDRAIGTFRATAFDDDGSVLRSFRVNGVKSGFAEIGTETVGSP